MSNLPALSVTGTATKRGAILELAQRADELGFAGLASPGPQGNLAMAGSLAHVTRRVPFWSSIQSISTLLPNEAAVTAAHLAEVSDGRFRLGLGHGHAALNRRWGVQTGPPLATIRDYISQVRAGEKAYGAMPPIYLASLRDKMLDLAVEIADGALWANASFRYTSGQVARVRPQVGDAYFFGVMVPTVIDADRDAARAVHRRTLSTYVPLPNYRNYWRAAGYGEEMDAIEAGLEARDRDAVSRAMSDRWIDDCTVSGSVSEIRGGLAAWYDAGLTPIAVMSSTSGGQAHAIRQLFDAYT